VVRFVRCILPLLLLAGLAAPAAAGAACGQVEAGGPTGAGSSPAPLAVGDSVMLGAFPGLRAAGFEVNARVCRQMGEGVDLLAARERAGTLPDVVVVALGTNWVVTSGDIRRALLTLGPGRVLGLVTPRETGGAASADQSRIRAAGRRWPTRVKVLDWVRYSERHGSWFGGDGLHLTAAGAAGFTRLLRRALGWSASVLTARWSPEARAAPAETLTQRTRTAGPATVPAFTR
jgi:hypothetical protein